eukprot:1262166-Alexandrium_andersonii.AAC.1
MAGPDARAYLLPLLGRRGLEWTPFRLAMQALAEAGVQTTEALRAWLSRGAVAGPGLPSAP